MEPGDCAPACDEVAGDVGVEAAQCEQVADDCANASPEQALLLCDKSFLNEPIIRVGDLSIVHFPICLKQSKEEARDDP